MSRRRNFSSKIAMQAPAYGSLRLAYEQLKPSVVGFFPLRVFLRCWDFPYSEAKSLHVPPMGFFPLRDGNISASLWAPSRLDYGQSEFFAMGSPTWSPSSTKGISTIESNQNSSLCWWNFLVRRRQWIQLRCWDFSHQKPKVRRFR